MFRHRFCCSLSGMFHVWAKVQLFIVRHGSFLGKDSVVHHQTWFMFGQRFCCSLWDMVHVWAKILLFIIWYGAILIQIMLFITWTEVLLFIIWRAACLGRGSVHYLIWKYIWTEFLFFIIRYGACLDTDSGAHYLPHPAAWLKWNLFGSFFSHISAKYGLFYWYFLYFFSDCHAVIGRRYIK